MHGAISHTSIPSFTSLHFKSRYVRKEGALARHALLRHLAQLGLDQSKPSLSAQACTWQSQAMLDGSSVCVWLASKAVPKWQHGLILLSCMSFIHSKDTQNGPKQAHVLYSPLGDKLRSSPILDKCKIRCDILLKGDDHEPQHITGDGYFL